MRGAASDRVAFATNAPVSLHSSFVLLASSQRAGGLLKFTAEFTIVEASSRFERGARGARGSEGLRNNSLSASDFPSCLRAANRAALARARGVSWNKQSCTVH
jgi:hypothetical protein